MVISNHLLSFAHLLERGFDFLHAALLFLRKEVQVLVKKRLVVLGEVF
jgi:hypothetical protein